jgi:hypothetical protein
MKTYDRSVEEAGEGSNNEFPIPGFRIPEDWNSSYIHSASGIKAEGEFEYNDSFDDIPSQHFCVMTVAQSMIRCEDLTVYLRSLPPVH